MNETNYSTWEHPDYYLDKLTPEEEKEGGPIYGSLEDYIKWYELNK